jgi:hypothetical protein
MRRSIGPDILARTSARPITTPDNGKEVTLTAITAQSQHRESRGTPSHTTPPDVTQPWLASWIGTVIQQSEPLARRRDGSHIGHRQRQRAEG